MKKAKRLVAVLLTLAMIFAMAMSAFAATVTISGTDEGSTYSAYKLMSAEVDANNSTKITYTVNDKYSAILQSVSGKSEDEVIAYVSDLTGDAVQTFANAVYAKIAEAKLTADKTTEAAAANGTASFDLDNGYYLVAETVASTNKQATVSLVMLNTAVGETTISTKEGTPTVQKKVMETNDTAGTTTDWQDAADYDIGDDVPFQLTGTVSSKIASYDTYYYEFVDTLSKGLTYKDGSIEVKIDQTIVNASAYTVSKSTDSTTGETSLRVQFDDLKKAGVNVTADTKVVVTYTATLNDDAVIGSAGNPNVVYLKYANNPYAAGDGTNNTGETPKDKVIVFTYEIKANKVDGSNNNVALKGAGFTLFKLTMDTATKKATYEKVGDEITGVTTFEFKGTDAGTYKLVETTVPTGYNKADDLIFVVEATYDTLDDDPKLTAMAVKDANGKELTNMTATLTTGIVETNIANYVGSTLPETGGMGTTFLYVFGGVLVFVAVVVLITRKRVSSK